MFIYDHKNRNSVINIRVSQEIRYIWNLKCELKRRFVCIENTYAISERLPTRAHIDLERALLMRVVDSMPFELILKHWVGGAPKLLAKMM